MTIHAKHLTLAAEHLDGFNRRTRQPGDQWSTPADACNALAGLTALSQALSQALDRAPVPVLHAVEQGHRPGGPAVEAALRDLVAAREAAVAHADKLASLTARMWAATGKLNDT